MYQEKVNVLTKYFYNLLVIKVNHKLLLSSLSCIYVIKFQLENFLATYRIFKYFPLHAMFPFMENINLTEVFHVKRYVQVCHFWDLKAFKLFTEGFPSRIFIFSLLSNDHNGTTEEIRLLQSNIEVFSSYVSIHRYINYIQYHWMLCNSHIYSNLTCEETKASVVGTKRDFHANYWNN